jgi:hypothetical protein
MKSPGEPQNCGGFFFGWSSQQYKFQSTKKEHEVAGDLGYPEKSEK